MTLGTTSYARTVQKYIFEENPGGGIPVERSGKWIYFYEEIMIKILKRFQWNSGTF